MLKYAEKPALEMEAELHFIYSRGLLNREARYRLIERIDGFLGWSIIMLSEVSTLQISIQYLSS